MAITTMNKAECQTGTQNAQYDLLSLTYHALGGAATYEQYIADAKNENDSELVSFFEEAKSQSCDLADRAKKLLKRRL